MNLKKLKLLGVTVFSSLALLFLTACGDDSELEDAAEDAQDAVEDAADEVGDAAEKAADNVKDATN